MTYIADGCYKYTFDAKKVKSFVEQRLEGEVLNLFAGQHEFPNHNETRVDLNPDLPNLHYCCDAQEALDSFLKEGRVFDTIIYDPPWNARKSKEFYEGRYIGKFTKMKNSIAAVLKPNGKIISLGYEITNFGKVRGFYLHELGVVDPKGEIRPYFISIERKLEG